MNIFYHLSDMISAADGVEENFVARITCGGWKKSRELLLALTSNVFSLRTRGKPSRDVSGVFFSGETWAVKGEDLKEVRRNNMIMVRWMSNVSLKDRKSSDELKGRLGLVSIRNCIERIDEDSLDRLKEWTKTFG